MKKLLLLAVTICFFTAGIINAQVIYSENFDALNTGEGIALQVPDNWTPWSGTVGSAEDPWVSDAYSVSPSNSLLIGVDNDVVMLVGELTENRYKMSFQFLLPEGNCGYYAPMQEFDAETPTYHNGLQIFFLNGSGDVDGGGEYGVAQFNFEHDVWNTFEQYFDLDNETTDIFVNEQVVYSGNWSNGINYYSNTLQGFDLYGWDESATPAMYYDDIVFEQVEAVDPPMNLSVELQNLNDVQVSWEEPTSNTPDSYLLYRNGELLIEIAGATSYFDENLYPNFYEYSLKAYYGPDNGYSAETDPVSIEIEGGTARQLVLLEIFTGTECTDAGSMNNALGLLANLNLNNVVINYQTGLYETSAYNSRSAFYVPFFDADESEDLTCPSSIINGMEGHEGLVGTLINQRNYFRDYILEYLDFPAIYTISPELDYAGSGIFNISVDIEELMAYYTGELRLFVALIESDFPEGSTEFKNVHREMIPDEDGTLLDFSTENIQNASMQFTLDAEYNMENCNLIFFVQNMENAYIMETAIVSLADFVNIENSQLQNISVFPNPAKDNVVVSANESILSLEVYNLAGQMILNIKANSNIVNINIESIPAGAYMLNIITENETKFKPLIIE
jgi:hypothetical protein